MRKILFLDVDGVLNHLEWKRRQSKRPTRSYEEAFTRRIDPECLARLNLITDMTGAVIVFSSSWREGRPWRESAAILRRVGMTGTMIDRTPTPAEQDGSVFAHYEGRLPKMLEPYPRGYEIQQWIDAQSFAAAPTIVILDDDDDMAHLANRLVRTDSATGGLQFGHARRAIAMLNGS